MSITPSAGNVNLETLKSPGFIQGMNVSWTSNTTLTVTSGVAVDSTGVSNIILEGGATPDFLINCANVGLNGIDTGVLANSTNYYVFAIGSSVNKTFDFQGCLVSLSSTNPTLPAGFDMFRLIDMQKTNGSAQFLKSYNVGNGNTRTKYWDAAISVLTSGAATSLTAVDLSPAVFPGLDNLPVRLSVSFTPNAAGNKVSIAPFGSTSTSLPAVSGSVAAVAQIAELNVIAKLNTLAPSILYINSAATGATTLLVTAFTMQI